jgi:hypothetical protein
MRRIFWVQWRSFQFRLCLSKAHCDACQFPHHTHTCTEPRDTCSSCAAAIAPRRSKWHTRKSLKKQMAIQSYEHWITRNRCEGMQEGVASRDNHHERQTRACTQARIDMSMLRHARHCHTSDSALALNQATTQP